MDAFFFFYINYLFEFLCLRILNMNYLHYYYFCSRTIFMNYFISTFRKASLSLRLDILEIPLPAECQCLYLKLYASFVPLSLYSMSSGISAMSISRLGCRTWLTAFPVPFFFCERFLLSAATVLWDNPRIS